MDSEKKNSFENKENSKKGVQKYVAKRKKLRIRGVFKEEGTKIFNGRK